MDRGSRPLCNNGQQVARHKLREAHEHPSCPLRMAGSDHLLLEMIQVRYSEPEGLPSRRRRHQLQPSLHSGLKDRRNQRLVVYHQPDLDFLLGAQCCRDVGELLEKLEGHQFWAEAEEAAADKGKCDRSDPQFHDLIQDLADAPSDNLQMFRLVVLGCDVQENAWMMKTGVKNGVVVSSPGGQHGTRREDRARCLLVEFDVNLVSPALTNLAADGGSVLSK